MSLNIKFGYVDPDETVSEKHLYTAIDMFFLFFFQKILLNDKWICVISV